MFKGDDVRALAPIVNYLKPDDYKASSMQISSDINNRVKAAIKGETFKDIEDTFDSLLKAIKSSISF